MEKTSPLFTLTLAFTLILHLLPATSAEPVFENPPRAPGPESWKFREELAAPEKFPAPNVGEGKTPWLKDRISRCFFGPIKRQPYFRDELMDDVNYYPEEYLKRLQREGVNGLWLTVDFRDLVAVPTQPPPKDAERRLSKLRRTAEACAKYGIKTWLFAIEPDYHWKKDSDFVKAHPDWFGPEARGVFRVMCSSAPEVRKYLEDATYEIFTKVPGLGGLIVLSHGECPSSCISCLRPDNERNRSDCPRCGKLQPWQVHLNTMGSMLKGVRRANPEAKVISWLYHPQATPKRGSWVYELAKHVPEGMILQYNFESGIEAEQEKKVRCGGDYWLSEPGPGVPFKTVAASVRAAGGTLSAKIQTCNSHELATVPYVPAPGLLYRKFKAMRAEGVTSSMLCWYFGSYPGVMNRAMGELAHSDFTETEDEFLLRLAKPQWGDQAEKMAKAWKSFTDGYVNYPLDNAMQYYGPFHSGVIWPLWADVNLQPLVETWPPDRPACGDFIGECLGKFNLKDALALAEKMKKGVDVPLDIVAANEERAKDLGVMKAFKILVTGGRDILEFYRLRGEAVHLSRDLRNHQIAANAVSEMVKIVDRAKKLTEEMIPLCEADSRLGFHSEAESHQFHPANLRWRLKTLEATRERLKEIERGLWKGVEYPESAFEKNAPRAFVGGEEVKGRDLVWRAETNAAGDLVVKGRVSGELKRFSVAVTDATGTMSAKVRTPAIAADGSFELVYSHADWADTERERPGWILFQTNFGSGRPLWPVAEREAWGRLNIGAIWGRNFGRLVWPRLSLAEFHRRMYIPCFGFRRANMDESMVEPYTLEDPLVFTNGAKVTRANWAKRRAEILDIFAHEMYGAEPPPPENVKTELVEEKKVLDGKALRRRYRLSFAKDGFSTNFVWNVWLRPDGKAKGAPFIIGLTYHEDDEWEKKVHRGENVYIPIADLVAKGYAVMSTTYAAISPDISGFDGKAPDPYTGFFRLWGPRDTNRTDNVTALGAWAWAVSRGIDLAETLPELDVKRSLVTGYSRLGKVAMIAAARDARIAYCVPVQTGGGGTPLLKRDYGESVSTGVIYFPHWYCTAFRKYAEAPWRDMPFDTHLFLASIAPRKLMVLGFDNFWYDPKGERLATEAAGPVWDLFNLPRPTYFCRDGSHGMNAWDWDHILEFFPVK